MTLKTFATCLLCAISLVWVADGAVADKKPNIIVILTDDLGYGDIGCYGAKDIATPYVDQMAKDGANFTSFYVTPVCSPTRVSFLTGCIPQRVGIGGVMFPRNTHGLNPDEKTLPELLKEQGYATAIIGKWHVGNQDKFQPLNHGFDYWFGTPASNSQFFDPTIKKYAKDCVWREGYTYEKILKMDMPRCPLVRNNLVIEVPADQTQFTKRYTEETIKFITKHKDKPFFVYLPHNMPHLPLHASAEFVGKSKRGIYGDAIQEIDWSTGQILKALKDLGLDANTLVIFTSDNGPNLGKQGRALPLRGSKGNTYEGGVRVPFIARWPGKIPAGRKNDEPITVMDLLPTLTKLAGGAAPGDRVIDGKDIWPLLCDAPGAKSPHDAIYYLKGRSMQGIRVGDWKYRYAQDKPGKDGRSKKEKKAAKTDRKKKAFVEALYNLRDDIGEQKNLIDDRPELADRLKKQMEAFNADLKKNTRPAGTAE